MYFVVMAKQAGDIKIIGTVDDLCFYKMDEVYYVRMKSSLMGKRFWKDKAFEGSRTSALLLGKASKIASSFYRSFPKEKKYKGLFNEMTGKVKLWLKEGKSEEEALLFLEHHYPVRENGATEVKTINKAAVTRIVPRWRNDAVFIIPGYNYRRKRRELHCLKE